MVSDDERRLSELTVGDAKRILVYGVMLLLAVGLFFALLDRIAVAVLLGVVAAYYLLPVQRWLEGRVGAREGSALVTIALIVLPLAGLTLYLAYELSGYTEFARGQREGMIRALSEALSRYLPIAPGSTRTGLEVAFGEAVARSAEAVQAVRRQGPRLLSSLVLFFFTVFYVLTRRAWLQTYIKSRVPGDYLPVYERLSGNIGDALHGALTAVFIDQLIKAGVILALNLVFGVPLTLVLAVVAFLIGFFPLLGEWAVYLPVSAYLLVFRQSPLSAGVYLGCGLLLTLCSSLLLRPRLASSRSRRFSFYWMLLALVAGVYSFGIPGIVLGPVILGFAKAVIDTLAGKVRPETSLLVTEAQQEKPGAGEGEMARG